MDGIFEENMSAQWTWKKIQVLIITENSLSISYKAKQNLYMT